MNVRGSWICGCCCALLLACASGGSATYDDGQSGQGDDGGLAEGGSGADSSSGATRFDSGGGSSSGSSGGTTSSSSSSGGQGTDAGDDGGGGGSCTASDTCSASATMLGALAGDQSGTADMAMGAGSEWLRIDMQEKDSSPLAVPMKITATLTSPSGTNFDLYAYLGSGIGSIVCSGAKGQSTNPAGQVDTVSFEWGETGGGFANGKDDSATVMIEVRWVSGACGAADAWSLAVQGH